MENSSQLQFLHHFQHVCFPSIDAVNRLQREGSDKGTFGHCRNMFENVSDFFFINLQSFFFSLFVGLVFWSFKTFFCHALLCFWPNNGNYGFVWVGLSDVESNTIYGVFMKILREIFSSHILPAVNDGKTRLVCVCLSRNEFNVYSMTREILAHAVEIKICCIVDLCWKLFHSCQALHALTCWFLCDNITLIHTKKEA